MPSHLTRHVFQRLLANEPMVHRACLRRQCYSSLTRIPKAPRTRSRSNGMPSALQAQRRSFWNSFNIFKKREDEVKEADMDPGIDKMMELAKRERMRARMPPLEDVVKALGQYFEAKLKKKQPMPDNQAQLVLQSLRYYVRERNHEAPSHIMLRPQQLILAVQRLRHTTEAPGAVHVDLAKFLYEMLQSSGHASGVRKSFVAYIQMLSATGSAQEARRAVLEYEQAAQSRDGSEGSRLLSDEADEANDPTEMSAMEKESSDPDPRMHHLAHLWAAVLRGFAREGNESEVQHTLQYIEQRGLQDSLKVSGAMIDFCLSRDDLPGMRQWWSAYQRNSSQISKPLASGHYVRRILMWCLAHGELEAGHDIVREVMLTNPPKTYWDAIFVWGAGTKRSVDEIDRMMSVMEKHNEAIPDPAEWRVPDIATINGLVEYAISKNDPYMAERFITLGRERNIEPDARTYVLQMEYRLSVDDVDGALIAYKNLQSMDLSSNEDVPTVNRLLVALCKTQRHDFDTIMNVAADLSDRCARFEAETTSTLALLHLRRDEHRDVLDLLNTHAYHYSTSERVSIRDAIIAFAVNPTTPIAQAWSGYHIIYSIFDETPEPQRTELMLAFFSRERADMGVRIFQNMRMHSRADTLPTVSTYASAFMALAKLRDLENLEVIHNLLKLDYTITPTTHLYNTLIIAFTACGEARKALGFWDDIVASKEGPSYNSLHCALRACEKAPFGDLKARELWSLLKRRHVDLDHSLWCSYIAALAGNGDIDAAVNVVEEAADKGEVEVDAFLLGSFFAGAPGPVKKSEVEVWAKEAFPGVWGELEGLGEGVDGETGTRSFNIDRRVAP